MSQFEKELKEKASFVEQALAECFEKKFDAPDNIVSAMKYSLFAGGKRLRPVMMIETCKSMGGDVNKIIKLACALEMIHTYSLIHDDLPAMDNDELRRGKPTNHVVYGEDIAILAGDALLNYAMETAVSGPIPTDYRDLSAKIRAFQVMFKSSGVNGMIGGQTGDILCETLGHVTESHIQYVHEHKTGALFVAAVVCGGIIAHASDEDLALLKKFAQIFGMIFQIVDDILDVIGNEKELGKPIHSDEKNEKMTFVSLYGLNSAKEKVQELNVEAKSVLSRLEHDTQFLEKLTDYICDRTY